MIPKGTDGLSGGMQEQPFAANDGIISLQEIFRPAEFTPAVLSCAWGLADLPRDLRYKHWRWRSDFDKRDRSDLLDL